MIYLIGINLVAFVLCYVDKKRAIANRYRICENVLLLVSLIGGVFGFILSMYLFHHKTRKLKFLILEPIFLFFWVRQFGA